MIARIEVFFRKIGRLLSRSEWSIRLLNLSESVDTATDPGLVLIQIDGLGLNQFQRALRKGNLPFLSTLLKKEGYSLHRHYAGMPSSTPAVQGELFYGVKGCVCAFKFQDKKSGRIFTMFEPEGASAVERCLEEKGQPLLKGGSSYSNIFGGGAAESHFCAATVGWGKLIRVLNPITMPLTLLFNFHILIRVLVLLVIEFGLAIWDFFRGIISGKNFIEELRFIFTRVSICIVLRELIVVGACIDIARGIPIIHLNLLGYDEQAHRRGPSSGFAHWSLKGIDYAVSRLWKSAQHSSRRDYDVWIYSDHGQEECLPYSSETGKSIQNAIEKIFKSVARIEPGGLCKFEEGIQSHRMNLLRRKTFLKEEPLEQKKNNRMIVTGMGPVGHVYPGCEIDPEKIRTLAQDLVSEVGIPAVLIRAPDRKVEAFTETGHFVFPEEIEEWLGPGHPFPKEVAADLIDLCYHEDAGTFILFGWRSGRKSLTFALEGGSHGGPGPNEVAGFGLFPQDILLPVWQGKDVRPLDIYRAAQHHMGRMPLESEIQISPAKILTFRIMTYNVHSCIGMDGKISPHRIARIIARYHPDVVALQELDVGRIRTGNIDQAKIIADKLKMEFHFQPAVALEEEQYGDAILSRYPMKKIRAGALPRYRDHKRLEPRGALWVEIDLRGRKIQLINTHLSLWWREQLLQIKALLGPDWLGSPDCSPPAILCGDFNALPNSIACRQISCKMRDAQLELEAHNPLNTWLGRYPLSRIDHVFIGPPLNVVSVCVPRTGLEKVASDHLPLIVEVQLSEEKTE